MPVLGYAKHTKRFQAKFLIKFGHGLCHNFNLYGCFAHALKCNLIVVGECPTVSEK